VEMIRGTYAQEV